MTKVLVEIEIPDGHEVVDEPQMVEWSNTAVGEARSFEFRVTARPVKPLTICGQPADWPEMLKCDWIAKDEDGQIYSYSSEPSLMRGGWDGLGFLNLSELLDIYIPGPWEQSKRENPRRKK